MALNSQSLLYENTGEKNLGILLEALSLSIEISGVSVGSFKINSSLDGIVSLTKFNGGAENNFLKSDGSLNPSVSAGDSLQIREYRGVVQTSLMNWI